MLSFVPPTVCGTLWHNLDFVLILLHWGGGATNAQPFALILSKVEPIFSRKWVWSQFPINLLVENVLSPLIQVILSLLLLQSFYCWQIPDPPGAAPDSDRRQQTLEEGRCLLWLSSLHPIRLSTVSSVRSPSLPGFLTGIYFNTHTLNSFSGSVLILNLIQCLCPTSMSLTNFYVLKCDAFNSTFSCTFPF